MYQAWSGSRWSASGAWTAARFASWPLSRALAADPSAPGGASGSAEPGSPSEAAGSGR
jgi:hypothetical protein